MLLPPSSPSSVSINHVNYEALKTRPIAVIIETKTESRTVEEAKVQLGVRLAGQVGRMEDLILQIVFPLLDGQSENWSFFLGRVSPNLLTSTSSLKIQEPASPIQILSSMTLGNTANTVQTYRLVKGLKALRAWIDVGFRMCWDKVLIIAGDGESDD
ncbi:hypothetical protein EK21DRAFT_56234 [Setomelanomma holmii]|uniref:PD-(D/E)XK nuclease-like domain-containing protein n=1 Tax=Setomelanomma holmii TaxID=210430 RepID=A0A9P4LR11_9PLEO|nr:hypothetical protein EK21DRAFT_56234 [Setomelanomma holmii]